MNGYTRIIRIIGIPVLLLSVNACSIMGPVASKVTGQAHAGKSQTATTLPPAPMTAAPSCSKTQSSHYVGISVPGFPPNASKLATTEQAMGIKPNIISIYTGLSTEISKGTVESICSDGAVPLVDIDSGPMPLSQITDGKADPILRQDALELGTLQIPVAVDFDHEFNGPWWHWGYTHVSPSAFVAAWRHIVNIFRRNGATNVTWIWNPNVSGRLTAPKLQPWYPGNSYVNWIGLDGYFYNPPDTFKSVFLPTMDQIRSFSKKPFLIVETGANPKSGRVRAIKSLFQGAEATPDLLGIIWFDYDKYARHNWFINNDHAALSAFHDNATAYQK